VGTINQDFAEFVPQITNEELRITDVVMGSNDWSTILRIVTKAETHGNYSVDVRLGKNFEQMKVCYFWPPGMTNL
jgi:hypothetical protein